MDLTKDSNVVVLSIVVQDYTVRQHHPHQHARIRLLRIVRHCVNQMKSAWIITFAYQASALPMVLSLIYKHATIIINVWAAIVMRWTIFAMTHQKVFHHSLPNVLQLLLHPLSVLQKTSRFQLGRQHILSKVASVDIIQQDSPTVTQTQATMTRHNWQNYRLNGMLHPKSVTAMQWQDLVLYVKLFSCLMNS